MASSSIRRRGNVIILVMAAAVPLVGFAALAVDYGRATLVKAELAVTCDVAARVAVTGLGDGTAIAKANAAAAENRVDGAAHVFRAGDVEPGRWDAATKTFTPATSGANAVRVTAQRSAARGNAVPLTIGAAIGLPPLELTARTVARFRSQGYGIIGLDEITMSGNSSSGYWSNGTPAPTNPWGAAASNGNISLSGSSSIDGDVRPGVGRTVSGASAVRGSTAPLKTPLSFPNGVAGMYATQNDNANIPSRFRSGNSLSIGSDALTLPGGTYYVHDLTVSGSGSLTFTGPATIYCYGSLSLSGSATTNATLPKNLKIVMCRGPSGSLPGDVTLSGSTALYANIYAPQSTVTISGDGDFYGSILGRKVTTSGSAKIYYDQALALQSGVAELVR